MRIAVTSAGDGLDSALDMRFGRAAGFIVYDDATEEYEYLENSQNLQSVNGAGIQSGQKVCESGANVVITGHCGPKAFRTLSTGNVRVFLGRPGSVQDNLDLFRKDELSQAMGADVEGHW